MKALLLIFLGGGIGSILRYALSIGIKQLTFISFPFATLLANFLACGILIFTSYWIAHSSAQLDWLKPLIIIGFCGGLSTFSTFSYETFHLINQQQYWIALTNIVVNLLACVLVIFLLQKKLAL